MAVQKNLAEDTLIKIRDYKIHSKEFLEKGFMSYPQFQQFVRDTLNEYFSSVGGALALPSPPPTQDQLDAWEATRRAHKAAGTGAYAKIPVSTRPG